MWISRMASFFMALNGLYWNIDIYYPFLKIENEEVRHENQIF
jgi:cellobiose-specific phosphotransferase system component IIC